MLAVWNTQNSVRQQHIPPRNLVLFEMSPIETIVLGRSEAVTGVATLNTQIHRLWVRQVVNYASKCQGS